MYNSHYNDINYIIVYKENILNCGTVWQLQLTKPEAGITKLVDISVGFTQNPQLYALFTLEEVDEINEDLANAKVHLSSWPYEWIFELIADGDVVHRNLLYQYPKTNILETTQW